MTAAERAVCVHVGFNHRSHSALLKARAIADSGESSDVMFQGRRLGILV